MTRIKDPKQVWPAPSGKLFILITSSSAGFVALSWLRERVSGRRSRSAGRGPRGAERRQEAQDRAGQVAGRAGVSFAAALPEPPAPGRGVEGAGVALEVRRCVDPPAARRCSSRGSSSPLRRRRLLPAGVCYSSRAGRLGCER